LIKIHTVELKQLVSYLDKTSNDAYLLLSQVDGKLFVQFQNADGQIVEVTLFDESTQLFAKVTSSERLANLVRSK
jgi:hypothetical protein